MNDWRQFQETNNLAQQARNQALDGRLTESIDLYKQVINNYHILGVCKKDWCYFEVNLDAKSKWHRNQKRWISDITDLCHFYCRQVDALRDIMHTEELREKEKEAFLLVTKAAEYQSIANLDLAEIEYRNAAEKFLWIVENSK